MQIYDDTIDLYSQNGEILDGNVPIEAISPIRNPAIAKIIFDIKRSSAVNLIGIEKGLNSGAIGGKSTYIPGRELDLQITENAEIIGEKIKKSFKQRKVMKQMLN